MGKEEKSILGKLWNKIKFELDMWRLDSLWRFYNGHHRQLFPPSFFYRHTPEEAERIVEETMENLKDVIRQYEAREDTTDTP